VSKTAKPKHAPCHCLDAETERANQVKKMLPCLVCGKAFLTDRCHRTCKKCAKPRENTYYQWPAPARGGGLTLHFPRQFRDLSSDADALWDF